MRPLDTSRTALERQRAAFRLMTPQQRVAAAAEMSDEVRAIARAGIRARHPDWSDRQVQAALMELLLRPDVT